MATINKKYGEQYIATASPSTGYRFVKWSGEGVDTTDNPATLTCLGDNTIEAIFERLQYTVSVGAYPANSGSIVFDPVLPNVIKYNATQALSGSWINSNTDTTKNTYNSTTGEGQLYLNEGVNTIPNSFAFYTYGTSLRSIQIPSNITSIGNAAFYECTSLTSVELPNSLTSIGQEAFYECTSLTSIDLPNSLTSIGSAAFHEAGLTSLTIPNSLTDITAAFQYCANLTSVTLPNTLTTIHAAFENCTSLTSIIGLENTQVSDFARAFEGCTSLTSIALPSTTTGVYSLLYKSCSALTSFTCYATTPPTYTHFSGTYPTPTLYVPAASVSAYQSSNWAQYFSQILPIQ